MILDFAWLPPEINSERIFAGAGSGPLYMAAMAWDDLANDLAASASSFDAVIVELANGPWAGQAAGLMAAAATPYVSWLMASAGQAQVAAGLARTAATAFETALTATVHPAAVAANRVSLLSLIWTNFLGQNTAAIAATEFDYVEMWAQDVAAMLGYHGGASAVAATMTPFSTPPIGLAGLVPQAGSGFAGAAVAEAGVLSLGNGFAMAAQGLVSAAPAALTAATSAASAVPLDSVMSLAQIGMYPASMLISPMMSLAQGSNAGTAGLGAASAGLASDVPEFVGDTTPALKGIGGGAGVGAGMSAGLGQARLVGAMSVPPTWQGAMPKGMASSAMQGLGAMSSPAAMAQGMGPTGGMPMMPMPMGMGGAGGMPQGMMGRGGAGSHVVQSRPSVIPRTGVG